jgi:hypothetical protein
VTISRDRIHIGTHLTLITEQNDSGPGAYIRGVEFDGVTGMTGNEDRDWPALDPAFGLARRLGCEGIWFKHRSGVEFVTQDAEAARRCQELAGQRDGDQPAPARL